MTPGGDRSALEALEAHKLGTEYQDSSHRCLMDMGLP